jgi:hypothetical protein
MGAAAVLVSKVESGDQVVEGELPGGSFQLAACLEAEALYKEATMLPDASEGDDAVFDILVPLTELNNLYDRRHCMDAAAEESYAKEISIRVYTGKCSLSTIAKRMLLLLRYNSLMVQTESFTNHDLSQLEAYESKVIQAQGCALEGLIIIAAAGATATMTRPGAANSDKKRRDIAT